MQLRRQSQGQAHSSDGRSRFKQAVQNRLPLHSADYQSSGQKQPQIHRKNCRRLGDGLFGDPAVKEMRILIAPKNRQRVRQKNRQRCRFHAARSGAWRTTYEHQHGDNRLPAFAHSGQIRRIKTRSSGRDRLEKG